MQAPPLRQSSETYGGERRGMETVINDLQSGNEADV